VRHPVRNGSSGTTIEILIALTVFGSSALTVLVLGREKRAAKGKQPDEHNPEKASADAD
jgi:hypothetical protein